VTDLVSNGHRRRVEPDRETAATVGTLDRRWEPVCRLERLQPGRGVAALLGAGTSAATQVALFRVSDDAAAGEGVYAIGNVDPCSGAAVLSRGIVGDRKGEPVVASPIYKQSFSLVTGRCLDEPDKSVPVYRVRVEGGWVQVALG
jgi:nitrite reductase (NADH) small subunit